MVEIIVAGIVGLSTSRVLNRCMGSLSKEERNDLGGSNRCSWKKVSSLHRLIELLSGLFYGVVIYHFGITVKGVMICALITFMGILTLLDIKYMLLPTKIIVMGACIALGVRAVGSYVDGNINFVLQGIWGGLAGYGILALVFFISMYLFKKEGMGYGDVRYLGMIGLFTSWQEVLLGLFIGLFIGSIYGMIQLKIKKNSEPFPFGPFMSLGAIISVVYGTRIMQWYMNAWIL